MQGDRLAYALVAILGVTVLLAPASQAARAQVDGTFATQDEATLGGQIDLSGAGGLHVDSFDRATFNLSASRATITVEWERGKVVDGPTVNHRRVDDSGRTFKNLTSPDLEIQARDRAAELLLEPGSASSLDASGLGTSSVRALPSGAVIAAGGYSESTEGSGQDVLPRATYRAQEPLVAVDSLDRVALAGSTDLFANNATIQAQGSDGERFSTWTGYRTTDRTGPVTEYELRVVVIRLEDAQVQIEHPDGVTLLSVSPDLELAGALEADQARGRISVGEQDVDLEGGPLYLSGDGRVSLDAVPEGDQTNEHGAGMVAAFSGAFDVVTADTVDPAGTAQAPAQKQGGSWIPFAAGMGFAVLLGGAVYLAWRNPAWLRVLPARLRVRLYERWKAQAYAHEDARRREAATSFYQRMASIRPRQPTGWYGAAVNMLESGRPAEALETLAAAREALEEVPLDLIELQIAAAAREGRYADARDALFDLVDASPTMAETLLEELDLAKLRNDPAVQVALAERRRGWLSR